MAGWNLMSNVTPYSNNNTLIIVFEKVSIHASNAVIHFIRKTIQQQIRQTFTWEPQQTSNFILQVVTVISVNIVLNFIVPDVKFILLKKNETSQLHLKGGKNTCTPCRVA